MKSSEEKIFYQNETGIIHSTGTSFSFSFSFWGVKGENIHGEGGGKLPKMYDFCIFFILKGEGQGDTPMHPSGATAEELIHYPELNGQAK